MIPTRILINVYIVSTFTVFGYLYWKEISVSDNYFAAVMNMYQQPFSNLLIYNVIISSAILIYRIGISIFYEEIKQIQAMNVLEKMSFKIFEFFYFINISGLSFGVEPILLLTFIFLSFLFHNFAVFRARYLINTHVLDQMSLNYRLLAHFIILLFFDYEIVRHTIFWFFSSDLGEQIYILVAYYAITISMTIIQPAICFFIHFYEIYTESVMTDGDFLNARLNFYINIVRLSIQIILSCYISFKLAFNLLFFITIIESAYQLMKIYKNYQDIHRWTEKIKNLQTLNAQQIKNIDDKTCAICYHDFVTEATVLTGCKHKFHGQCLRQWIIKNSNKICPTCKTPLDSKKNITRKMADQLREQMVAEIQKRQRQDPLGFQEDTKFSKINMQTIEAIQEKIKQQNPNPQVEQQEMRQNPSRHKSKHPEGIQQSYKNKKIKRKVSKYQDTKIGSVPFGLPTQAVYCRKNRDIQERRKLIQINNKMIKLLRMQPTKQLLFVPQV